LRKLISLAMTGILAMGLGVGISGCTEESGTKTVQTTTNPDGSKTKETVEHKVQTSGENPPAPASKP
jgi:hypothetical protein